LEAAQQRPEEIEVLEQQRKRAEAAIEQSKPELDRAEALVKNGTSPASRLDQAKAAYNRDAASLGEIEKQIAVARMRSRTEDIEAARTVVTQAEAHLSAAEIRGQQRIVRSPATGLVQEVFYRPGEVVPAGRPVVSVLPPNNLKLRFFVPQSQLPLLHQGQMVNVHCDGCAQDLAAKVTFISSQAEFTPPVIFSELERQKLVFRIEAHPEQPERFRVGQPVTVDMTHAGAG
jgi:HlyD family secretion protein